MDRPSLAFLALESAHTKKRSLDQQHSRYDEYYILWKLKIFSSSCLFRRSRNSPNSSSKSTFWPRKMPKKLFLLIENSLILTKKLPTFVGNYGRKSHDWGKKNHMKIFPINIQWMKTFSCQPHLSEDPIRQHCLDPAMMMMMLLSIMKKFIRVNTQRKPSQFAQSPTYPQQPTITTWLRSFIFFIALFFFFASA